MDSSSPLIRNCYRKICIWGKKTPIIYAQPYEGGPTPIYSSPQKKFYMIFTFFNLLLFLVMIISYIVQFKLNANAALKSCINIDLIYIVCIIFVAVNSLWYLFLWRVQSATD